jgi:hypothetical protein
LIVLFPGLGTPEEYCVKSVSGQRASGLSCGVTPSNI